MRGLHYSNQKLTKMNYYYHYTAKKNIDRILKNGVFRSDSNYTKDEYYNARAASTSLGIPVDSAEVVLKFADDGYFISRGLVADSNRYLGGGSQYEHRRGNLKPVALRNIQSTNWENL